MRRTSCGSADRVRTCSVKMKGLIIKLSPWSIEIHTITTATTCGTHDSCTLSEIASSCPLYYTQVALGDTYGIWSTYRVSWFFARLANVRSHSGITESDISAIFCSDNAVTL